MKTNTFHAKKVLALLFAALLPLVASAQTKVEIDGIWYNLTAETREAEVTSSGGTKYSGSITIPATVTHNGVEYSVTSIGDFAFDGCSSLTAITIPEGVTSIGGIAFYKCSNLTAITLPEGVTSIGVGAFFWCSSLTAITLPASVTSIGGSAFNGCESLTDVYCNAEEIPHTSTNAFSGSNIENATLHVPASAMDEYKTTAPWSSFGTIKDIEKGDADGILIIPAKPVLIQCQGGVITVSGLADGTEVAVYTANATAVATATATDGTATLTTNLTAGTIAIVKTGDYSIKVAIK